LCWLQRLDRRAQLPNLLGKPMQALFETFESLFEPSLSTFGRGEP
jgi:hypothetical protein